jgi:hypothetical protein
MQQLSASVTATSIMTNSVFPFFTDDFFEIAGGYVDGMGGIMSVSFSPLLKPEMRSQWEEYAVEHRGWIQHSKDLREAHPEHRQPLYGTVQDHEDDRRLQSTDDSILEIPEKIWRWENGTKVFDISPPGEWVAPVWQISPPKESTVMVNLFSDAMLTDLYGTMMKTNQSVLSAATEIGDLFDFMFDDHEKHRKTNPHGYMLEPVYSSFGDDKELVGFLTGLTAFENLLSKLIPAGVQGIVGVITDTCGNSISYELNGTKPLFLGYDDFHDPAFNGYRRSVQLEMYETVPKELCVHDLHIYPSDVLRESYETSKPIIYTVVVATAFLVTAMVLFSYDVIVNRRQEKTTRAAMESNALVSSLFPTGIRDRIYKEAKHTRNGTDDSSSGAESSKPIADFFPESSVMFADIAGFTAWSSTRGTTSAPMERAFSFNRAHEPLLRLSPQNRFKYFSYSSLFTRHLMQRRSGEGSLKWRVSPCTANCFPICCLLRTD